MFLLNLRSTKDLPIYPKSSEIQCQLFVDVGPLLSSRVWYRTPTEQEGGRPGSRRSETVSTRRHSLEPGKARALWPRPGCPCSFSCVTPWRSTGAPSHSDPNDSGVSLSSSGPRRAALWGLQDLKAKPSPDAASHSGLRSQCPALPCFPSNLFSQILLAMSFPPPPHSQTQSQDLSSLTCFGQGIIRLVSLFFGYFYLLSLSFFFGL